MDIREYDSCTSSLLDTYVVLSILDTHVLNVLNTYCSGGCGSRIFENLGHKIGDKGRGPGPGPHLQSRTCWKQMLTTRMSFYGTDGICSDQLFEK